MTQQALPPSPPKREKINAYYDPAKKGYLVLDDDQNWIGVDMGSMKTRLAQAGFSVRKGDDPVSPADAVLVEIQQQRSVAYVGPLAGYDRGCYHISGYKVLVTHSPTLIIPKKGEWPLLHAVIENQFKDDNESYQATYFYGWLLCSIKSLYSKSRKYGQALVLAGPKGCGKSLLQNIVITKLLGGRSAKPYRYMMGKTQFNRELFGAEHQMIEDDAASTDPRVRMHFGSAIKQLTATREHSCHGKGREAVMLDPGWRLTISVNDEPQNLMILPPIEDSLSDKLIILRSVKHPMPMPTATAEEEALFGKALEAELPAFLWWLQNEFQIPPDLQSDRYGIKHYVNAHIAASIDSLSPHTRLLNLIDQVFWTPADFTDSTWTPLPEWKGTAEAAENLLHNSNYRNETARLLTWAYAMGAYLGELAKHRPDRVKQDRSASSRGWIITRPVPCGTNSAGK